MASKPSTKSKTAAMTSRDIEVALDAANKKAARVSKPVVPAMSLYEAITAFEAQFDLVVQHSQDPQDEKAPNGKAYKPITVTGAETDWAAVKQWYAAAVKIAKTNKALFWRVHPHLMNEGGVYYVQSSCAFGKVAP